MSRRRGGGRSIARGGGLWLAIAGLGACGDCSGPRSSTCPPACPPPHLARLEVLAGQPGGPGWVDGTLAAAHFTEPWALAGDGHDRLYVADLHTIRTIDKTARTVTTLAGDHRRAGAGDGVGVLAGFNTPCGLAFESGALYVADTENHAIRKIDVATATVVTAAGVLGAPGAVDAVGSSARFREPEGLALDGRGNLYIGDTDNNTIRVLSLASGAVSTLAGTAGAAGTDDGVGPVARFNKPKGLTIDRAGHLYAIDATSQSIRKIDIATRAVSTVATFPSLPQGLAMDGLDLLVSLAEGRVVRISPEAAIAGWVGAPTPRGAFADGPAPDARFNSPAGLYSDASGAVYVADLGNSVIRAISLSTAVTTTFAGARSAGTDDGPSATARFSAPQGVVADDTAVYVADTGNSTIRRIALASGEVTTLAGGAGRPGLVDGKAQDARFSQPQGIALDPSAQKLYVADTQNHKIRQIDLRARSVTTLAYSRSPGDPFGGFDAPAGLAIDAGRLFVTDYSDHVVVAIDLKEGRLSTLAGKYGAPGRADGVGKAAAFYGPVGLAADGRGNLYVGDDLNETVRKIDIATATVSTLAGQPVTPGTSDGRGPGARFHYPMGAAADRAGTVFVADSLNNAVRRVDGVSREVTTVVGTFEASGVRLGDLPAQIAKPSGLALTPWGALLLLSENAVLIAR